MIRKLNFLVIAVLSLLFVLIANAAEEHVNGTYNLSNQNSSYNTTILELNEALVNETPSLNNSNATAHNNETVNESIIINESINMTKSNTAENYSNEVNGQAINEVILNNTLINNTSINNTDASIEENNASNANETSDEVLVEALVAAVASNNIAEPEENAGKSITASFGVSLTIIG